MTVLDYRIDIFISKVNAAGITNLAVYDCDLAVTAVIKLAVSITL